jgi:hypothetical protein
MQQGQLAEFLHQSYSQRGSEQVLQRVHLHPLDVHLDISWTGEQTNLDCCVNTVTEIFGLGHMYLVHDWLQCSLSASSAAL